MPTYYWRTDAASGQIKATSIRDALGRLIAEGEWASTPACESRDIADGAWLAIGTEPEAILAELVRGRIP